MFNDPITNLPKKPTRRGRRRAKGAHGEHLAHLKAARECAECGDHKGAKAAAFKFIKALKGDEPEAVHNAAEEHAEAVPAKKTGGRSPALALLLARRGKK